MKYEGKGILEAVVMAWHLSGGSGKDH